MEHDGRTEQTEREAGAVTRNQNAVYTLPHDWSVIEQFLKPALDRLAGDAAGTQLLVLTTDAETALAVSRAALAVAGGATTVVPVTVAARAARVLRAGDVPAVAGPPAALLELVRASALKLDAVRGVVVAWADDLLTGEVDESIEALLGELPKDAARTIVTAQVTPAVEEFIDRYARRARRVGAPAAAEGDAGPEPVAIQYVSVGAGTRPAALRRLLDALDPPSAAVVVRSDESAREAGDALRALGYAAADESVRVVRGAPERGVALAVLYDVPTARAELDPVLGAAPVRLLALAQPRQLAQLRAVAAGGMVAALVLPDPADRARANEERLRAQLRQQLAAGVPQREVLALEPLLEEYDGLEIAAAALRLVERERERSASLQAGTHSGLKPRGDTRAMAQSFAPLGGVMGTAGPFKRIFMTIGEMDGIRKGDLVGAITGETGITADKIGKVELRENHSLVEIAEADIDRVIEAMNGKTLKSRRVVVRADQERSEREARTGGPRPPRRDAGAGDDRPRAPRRDFGDRPERGERPDRGERPSFGSRPSYGNGPRGARPGGGAGRPERGDRPAGGARFDRADRGPRPERGDRPTGGPPRGPRTGGFDRSDRPDRNDRGDAPERRPRAADEGAAWNARTDSLRNARRPRRDAE